MFAKVVVDVFSAETDEIFTYRVPEVYEDCIYIGSRVFIEFGFRKILGYVLELSPTSDFTGNIKEILEVVDFEQGLNSEQIELAKEISVNTKSFLVSALDLMIPSVLKSRVRKYINVLNYSGLDAELALFFGMKKKLLVTKEILSRYQKIKKEIDRGNLEIISDIYAYGKRKAIRYYRLKQADFEAKTEKQYAILQYISAKGEATAEEIRENTGCSDFLIQKLVGESKLYAIDKPPIEEITEAEYVKPLNFNFSQQQLKEKFQRLTGKPFLLVSNDDKFVLDFYLDQAYKTVKEKRQVLIVTPTLLSNARISLFFASSLKGFRISSFSSNSSDSMIYYNYQNVLSNNVDIVIATKSSIFLPLANIGLIIMVDEENPHYTNEQHPKFSTLEVLKFRSNYHQAKLLLSSSAPSISTYYQYYTAKYFLLEYKIPYSKDMVLVPMRNEYGDFLISKTLQAKLEENYRKKKVSMLLLNNLGYNSTVICEDCGKIIRCPECKTGLAYHKEKDLYRCPLCNSQTKIAKCENCGSSKVKRYGFGLEKLKEKLNNLFPEGRIAQVDSASMASKGAYESFFCALEENQLDFIIGTFVLAELSRPDITLAALINADSILNMSDYRSSEHLFQIITKLNQPQTTAVIQGYNLEHDAITKAVENRYEDFFTSEIENRKNYHYPPFSEVNRLLITGEYKSIYYFANYFKKIFLRITGGEILGPTYQANIKGVQLILKHQDFKKVSDLIDEVNKKFKEEKAEATFERYPALY